MNWYTEIPVIIQFSILIVFMLTVGSIVWIVYYTIKKHAKLKAGFVTIDAEEIPEEKAEDKPAESEPEKK